MFLNVLKRRNPQLILESAKLHREGILPSNCYVLDLDVLADNTRLLISKARRRGMKVFPMTKQISRHPAAIRLLNEEGADGYVTVDIQCARRVAEAGGQLGHVGHLVQIPESEIPWAVQQHPLFWTLFSEEKARSLSRVVAEGDRDSSFPGEGQRVLARLRAPGNTFYRGHEGGFPAEELVSVAEGLESLRGLKFSGITSFPCLLYDHEKKKVLPTPNLQTLCRGAEVLAKAGYRDIEINTPGTTSVEVLDILADHGATQVEPGHGLTGTTPLHAVVDLPERPALLYLTEVSHRCGDEAFCFGGGLYVDPVFPPYPIHCLTSSAPEYILEREVPVEFPADNAIDYYGMMKPGSLKLEAGDTVIMGFRPQTFVTRSYVAAVSGISSGKPVLEGLVTADGRSVQWPER